MQKLNLYQTELIMKKLLALRHVHFEDLGILAPEFINQGYDISYIDAPTANFSQYNPADYDLMVVLGAPIGAFDEAVYPFIHQELTFIQQYLSAGKPILGICLGAQYLARLLAAEVTTMGVKEIGFASIQLTPAGKASPLAHLADVPVLHWHGDQFAVPKNAQLLASTATCPNQAFAVGDNLLALQFHLEANPTAIEHWLVGHACELNHAKVDIAQIRADAKLYGKALNQAGVQVLRAWLDASKTEVSLENINTPI